MRSLVTDFSLSAVTAGFVTVLVGFTSSAAIVFQAAQALGASPAQIASWIWALGVGMGITCITLSWRYRIPVVTAWSTPGAAMLISSTAGITLPEATGAFILCAVLMALAGFTGLFERLAGRIPLSLGAGMLAGILLRFGLDAFGSIQTQPVLVLAMLATYLVARRARPRHAVMLTLAVGILAAGILGQLAMDAVGWSLPRPVPVVPGLSMAAIMGVALPLLIVTMASQNLPGLAVARASGYELPVSPTLGWIGITNALLAPFGAFALNLAAITAAICMGRDAHEDPSRRYVAGVAAGVFYLLVGFSGATVVALFTAFPTELIVAIAGIALLGTIGTSLATATQVEDEREPALVTFLVTASGLSIAGIGSAFWGLVAGAVALLVWKRNVRLNAS